MNRQMIYQQLPLKIADTLFTVLSSMFLEPWTCIASSKRPLFDVAN